MTQGEDKKRIIRNIRILRASKGFTAEQVSSVMKSKKRCADIEGGRVPCTIDDIVAIAHYLDTPLEYIISKTIKITFE